MHQFNSKTEISNPATVRSAIWRQALNSVFGAARRLHHYRDARDVLLRKVIQEQECQLRKRGRGERQCQ